MSNFYAIATVSKALTQRVTTVLQEDLGVVVAVNATKPPQVPPADAAVHVYLYRVAPNAALRNIDAPTRNIDGALVTRPQAAIDLHYSFTFYGEENQLDQRMVACVIRDLHERPGLSDADIQAAMVTFPESDLISSPQRVRFTPSIMDLDDHSRLWTVLSQTPHALTICYEASAVLLESKRAATAGPPVRRRTLTVLALAGPIIERVQSVPATDPSVPPRDGPVPASHRLLLLGAGLKTDVVTADVGGEVVDLPAEQVRDDRVVVDVPPQLPPGVHPVRLVMSVALTDHEHPQGPATVRKAVESNVAAFVRQPTVTAAVSQVIADGDLRSATVTLAFDMPVRVRQRVVLLIDELNPPGDRQPRSYRFTAPSPLPGGGEIVTEVPVAISRTHVGTYLMRAQVEGAESPLTVSADGSYDGPVVTLP